MDKKKKNSQQVKKSKFEKLSDSAWSYFIILFIAIIAFYRIIDFNLIEFDDKRIIEKANTGKSFIEQSFATDAYFENSEESRFYRPVQNLTILIDKSLHSSGYSLFYTTNLILHILTVYSLFYLLSILGYHKGISFILAIFFILHPLFNINVAWIPARGDILVALFSIISLIFLHKYLSNSNIYYAMISSAFILLAMFSKETSFVLPFVFAMYFYLYKKNEDRKGAKIFSLKDTLIFILWILPVVFYMVLKNQIFTKSAISYEFGLYEFFNNLRYYPEYFYKIFIPLNLSGMSQFSFLATSIGTVIILSIITFVIIKRKEINAGITIFAFFWIFLFLLPIVAFKSTYINTLEYWEHRAYIPMIGLVLIISEIIKVIKFDKKKIFVISSVIIVIFFSISTINLKHYSDSFKFFNNVIENGNELPNAYYSRATILKDRGDLDNSLKDLNKAISTNNKYFEAYFKRAVIYQTIKNFDLAIADYNQSIKLKPDFADSYMNLGYCYYYKKDIVNAKKCIIIVLRINPNDKDAQRINSHLEMILKK